MSTIANVRTLRKEHLMMAFTKVDKQRRINLFMDILDYAKFDCGNGTKYMIVNANDDGTEFDIVPEKDDLCVDGTVRLDSKGRVFIPSWIEKVSPGDYFRVSAYRGRIHVRRVSKEDVESNP